MRLIGFIFNDQDTLLTFVRDLAADIARKSPLTIRGIKDTLNYSRDHAVSEGLSYVSAKNAAILFSDDLSEAMTAAQEKRAATFDD